MKAAPRRTASDQASPGVVDQLGRVAIPRRLRPLLATEPGRIVIVLLPRGGLGLYSPARWRELRGRLDGGFPIRAHKSPPRIVRRWVIVSAAEASIDRRGRVLIPRHLRSYGHIGTRVVLREVSGHVEIRSAAGFLVARVVEDLCSAEEKLRAAAARRFARLDVIGAPTVLRKCLANDPSALVREASARSLGELGADAMEAVAELKVAAKHDVTSVARAARRALAKISRPWAKSP